MIIILQEMPRNSSSNQGRKRTRSGRLAQNVANANARRATRGRQAEYNARTQSRSTQDRQAEYSTRNRARNKSRAATRDRQAEYRARTERRRAQREQEDPSARIAALRDPIGTEISRRIASANAVENQRVIAERRKALQKSTKAASIPSPPPPGSQGFSAKCLMEEICHQTIPAPQAIDPATILHNDEDKVYLNNLVQDFVEKVHKAHVVTCGMCGELSISTKEPTTLNINTTAFPKIKTRDRQDRTENALYDERDWEKGYIKALVDEQGNMQVCASCAAKIREKKQVWQTAFDFGRVPECLKNLSVAETAFIQLYHPYFTLLKIKNKEGAGENLVATGHAATYVKNIRVYDTETRLQPGSVSDNIAVHFHGSTRLRTNVAGALQDGPLSVNATKIIEALQYLQQSSSLYSGISFEKNADTYIQARDKILKDYFLDNEKCQGIVGQAVEQANAQTAEAERAQEQTSGIVFEGPLAVDMPEDRETPSDFDDINVLRCLVGQKDEMINEFENNDRLFGGAFPHLFPTNGYPRKNMADNKQREHMVRYYDGRFGDPSFLSMLENQRLRHRVLQAYARLSAVDRNEFTETIGTPEFQEIARSALKNLEEGRRLDEEQQKIVSMMKRAVRVSLKSVPFSEGDKHIGKIQQIALWRARGPPLFFFTFSPSPTDNLLGIRLCFRNPHTHQPEHGRDETLIEHQIPYDDRLAKICENPVAAAMFFEHFTKHVFEDLLGVQLDTKAGSKNKKGILGTISEFHSVVECQGRTLLHMHVVLWAELTAGHLTDFARANHLETVKGWFEQTLLTAMPDSFYENFAEKWGKYEKYPAPALNILPQQNEESVLSSAFGRCQAHQKHKPTCWPKKGNVPNPQCRLRFPRPPAESGNFI